MEKITKVWFENNRIFINTNNEQILSRPLEAFPILMEANENERNLFEIGILGDDIRWKNLDEDIHISSFFENAEPNPENPIAKAFSQFPQINIAEFAKFIGIHKNLMAKYIYGIKNPSDERKRQIEKGLHLLASDLHKVKIA